MRTWQHLPICIKTGKSKEPWAALRARFSEYLLISVIAVVVIIITTVAALPLIAVAGYALLVTNILYINQFPDRKADEAAGKHHWVVRLGTARARWGYPAIAIMAYGWLVIAVISGLLPWLALVAILPSVMSFRAGRDLLRNADSPARLTTAIQLTIGAATLHGVLLAASMVAAQLLS